MWLTLCVCMCVVMRVCTTLCFLTWILKKAGPVRQWTNCALSVCQSALIFLRTLVGRGRASNRVGGLTGEDEKEGTSDEAAGLKIAPPPYPLCPQRFPPLVPATIPPPPSSTSSSSLSLMKKAEVDGEGIEVLLSSSTHPSFHGERSARSYQRAERQKRWRREDEGYRKVMLCLLTNMKTQTPNASSCFLSTRCKKL